MKTNEKNSEKASEKKSGFGKVAGAASAAAVMGATSVAIGLMGDDTVEDVVEVDDITSAEPIADTSDTAEAEAEAQAAAEQQASGEAAAPQPQQTTNQQHTQADEPTAAADQSNAEVETEVENTFENEVPVVEEVEVEVEANEMAQIDMGGIHSDAHVDMAYDGHLNTPDLAADAAVDLAAAEPVDVPVADPLDLASAEVAEVEIMETPAADSDWPKSIPMNDLDIDVNDAAMTNAAANNDMAAAAAGSANLADMVIEPINEFVNNLINPQEEAEGTFTAQVDQPEIDSKGLIQFDKLYDITDANGNVIHAAEFHYSDDGFPSIMADTTGDGVFDSIIDAAGNVLAAAPANMEMADAMMQLNQDADYMSLSEDLNLTASVDLGYQDNITDTGGELGTDMVDTGIDMG